MSFKQALHDSTLAKYRRSIASTPREVLLSPALLLSAALYAAAAIPLSWDQGSAATIPSLEGFQNHFHISSGSNAKAIKNFVSFVYLGDSAGAALSFFINDRIGRRWSFRLYSGVWIVGYLIAMFTPNVSGLYAARIISGLGIGALSVTGPMTIAELAPPEIRGLLTAWYSVMQMVALTSSTLTTYGIQLHMAPSRLQYQLALFVPCIFMFLLSIFSFWLPESPRWLMLAGAHDEAVTALLRLRRLPASHPRIQQEIQAIWETIESETELSRNGARSFAGIKAVAKETFTVRSNVYRLQQALILYVLPQLSGGNSVTNYFIPLTKILGIQHNPTHGIFLSGMYALSKLFFTLIASFILIDGLGRRGSLFLGTTMQMICNIYLAAYLKVEQDTGASHAASEAALAFIFINAFGYAVGLLTLPYCFGGELWPDNIRSFGAALAQTCHWLFHFGMTYGLPGLLAATDNWGAFVFFAAWCLIALVYVFFMVPEIANLSVEEMEKVFSRPMFTAYKAGGRKDEIQTLEGADLHDLSPQNSQLHTKMSHTLSKQ